MFNNYSRLFILLSSLFCLVCVANLYAIPGWHFTAGQSGHVQWRTSIEDHPNKGKESNFGWGIDVTQFADGDLNYCHYSFQMKEKVKIDKVKFNYNTKDAEIVEISVWDGDQCVTSKDVGVTGTGEYELDFNGIITFYQGVGVSIQTRVTESVGNFKIYNVGAHVVSE